MEEGVVMLEYRREEKQRTGKLQQAPIEIG
jgi:hypothetical protein